MPIVVRKHFGQPVVFPHPQRVHDRQLRKRVCPDVTSPVTRVVTILARIRFFVF